MHVFIFKVIPPLNSKHPNYAKPFLLVASCCCVYIFLSDTFPRKKIKVKGEKNSSKKETKTTKRLRSWKKKDGDCGTVKLSKTMTNTAV